MFNLPQVRIDRISFWLGFLAASLLWWLAGRIRPLIPRWREQLREYSDRVRQRNLAGVEGYLCDEAFQRAQRRHASASLFALNEVLIPPILLAPTPGLEFNTVNSGQSIASQMIPYLPEWPEVSSPFGPPVITVQQVSECSRNMAILGQPGSGKSVFLAHLACELAKRPEQDHWSPGPVPLLIHILDLQINPADEADPLDAVIKELSVRGGALQQTQVKRFLQSVLRDKHRKTVLCLDGLDELAQEQFQEAVKYIVSLQKNYPRLQIILAAPAGYLDGLLELGFYPLTVSSWKPAQRLEFLHQWGELWKTHIDPNARKSANLPEIDPVILESWVSGEDAYLNPLEWTLRVWGAYAGDLGGNNPIQILEAQLCRFLPNPAFLPALENLAYRMIQAGKANLSFTEMEKNLSGYKLAKSAALTQPDEAVKNEPTQEPGKKASRKFRRDINLTLGEQIINSLVDGGVLVEHANEQIGFSSPIYLGFLARKQTSAADAEALTTNLNWPAAVETLHYTASFSASLSNQDTMWVLKLIEDPAPPLYKNFFIACRWLRDAPMEAPWRSHLMRSMVILLQNELLPLSTRLQIIGGFYLSRDPSALKLFKQLLSSKSPLLRRAALLGCGLLNNEQVINDMLGLLGDPEPDVRYTACIAIAAIPGDTALNTLVRIMVSGDEQIRQAAAEALAQNGDEGYKLLDEASGLEDLLVRRAAVFGFTQIQQPWAREKLEKMAVEDGQWVVRNAAAHALEIVQQGTSLIPPILPQPSDSAWLISFASKMGVGILPGQPAIDVLVMALKSGTEEEQMAALNYLRNHPEEVVVSEIYSLIYSEHHEIHEPALNAIWWMSMAGAVLPAPAKFGLGD